MPIPEQELQMAQIEAEFISTHDIFPEGAAYCVSNPHLTDCPIVYASTTFCSQTGYSLDEITGKNCRFLQVRAAPPSPPPPPPPPPPVPPRGRLDASLLLCRRTTLSPPL